MVGVAIINSCRASLKTLQEKRAAMRRKRWHPRGPTTMRAERISMLVESHFACWSNRCRSGEG
eukprot:5526911-Alexandrium_andersonii.AAC.1